MESVERAGDLGRDREDRVELDRAALGEVAEVLPIEELHDQVGQAKRVAVGVEDLEQVRVVHMLRHGALREHPVDGVGVARVERIEQLHRDPLAAPHVLAQIDTGRAAARERSEHLVIAELLVGARARTDERNGCVRGAASGHDRGRCSRDATPKVAGSFETHIARAHPDRWV